MEWTNIEDKLPEKAGQYLTKDENGKEFPNFYAKNFRQQLVWITELGDLPRITQWKEVDQRQPNLDGK